MSTPTPAAGRAQTGFTLIELMIAVIVIAVIVAVALPSFLDSVRKSRRAEAMAALSAAQQAQERYRSANPTYASALSAIGITTPTSPGAYYAVSIGSASATGYVLTADGSGTSQASDGTCAKLSIQVVGGAVKYGSCAACTIFTYGDSDRCWSR